MKYEVVYRDLVNDVLGAINRYSKDTDTAVYVIEQIIENTQYEVLKNEVMEEFSFELGRYKDHSDVIYFDLGNKFDFIHQLCYLTEHRDFFRDHMDDLDDIMDIIRAELDAMDEEFEKEQEGESNGPEEGTDSAE